MSICPEHQVERVRIAAGGNSRSRCPEHLRLARHRADYSDKGKARHLRYRHSDGARRLDRYKKRAHYDRVESIRSIATQVARLDPRLQELI